MDLCDERHRRPGHRHHSRLTLAEQDLEKEAKACRRGVGYSTHGSVRDGLILLHVPRAADRAAVMWLLSSGAKKELCKVREGVNPFLAISPRNK